MIKPITNSELKRLSDNDLWCLHRQTYDALIQSDPQTRTRRIALATLDQVERELGARHQPVP